MIQMNFNKLKEEAFHQGGELKDRFYDRAGYKYSAVFPTVDKANAFLARVSASASIIIHETTGYKRLHFSLYQSDVVQDENNEEKTTELSTEERSHRIAYAERQFHIYQMRVFLNIMEAGKFPIHSAEYDASMQRVNNFLHLMEGCNDTIDTLRRNQ